MVVCHCRAVTDGRVHAEIARGATTAGDLVRACGAGGRCGGCLPLLERLLAEAGLGAGQRRDGAAAA